MEPAKIDWKTIDSFFVEDRLYEHINAPKWVDFSVPSDPNNTNQDEAWFCRPDCKHPKTVEDFYKLSPPFKLLSMVGVSDMLELRERNKREANLKRRQQVGIGRPDQNCENSDPNVLTPLPNLSSTSGKKAFKSSANSEKQKLEMESTEETTELKSTRSAKNLLGRDIFSHITEFCNELKKLAIRTKDEDGEGVKSSLISDVNKDFNHHGVDVDDRMDGDMDADEVARTPLMGIRKDKFGSEAKSREKLRLKMNDELENTPLSINLNSKRNQASQKLLKI